MLDMFRKADEVLLHSVKGITDLIMMPGLVNLDFADVKATMSKAGMAIMGIGAAAMGRGGGGVALADDVFALFAEPEPALDAALEIQRRIARFNASDAASDTSTASHGSRPVRNAPTQAITSQPARPHLPVGWRCRPV